MCLTLRRADLILRGVIFSTSACATAKMINTDDPDWENTAAGRRFSYKYGYGSLDASAYVQAAKDGHWSNLRPGCTRLRFN